MTILIVGILLILYSVLSQNKYSVWIGILFVLLIMGFQEGVPGDYQNYAYAYKQGGSEVGLVSYVKETEYSYYWLIHTLSSFMNFHFFVLLMSLIQCSIMAIAIKNYSHKRYQSFAVLVIFFTYNIMLLQMKAMRQGYAVEFLLFAYILLDRKKYLWSLLFVTLACGFHNTCLYGIPFFLIFLVLQSIQPKNSDSNVQKNKKETIGWTAPTVAIGLLIFYFLKFYVFQSYINPFLEGLELLSYEGYMAQMEENNVISWWILLYYSASSFCVSLYMTHEDNTFKKYTAILVIVSFYLAIGLFGYGNLQRFNMYFIIFCIIVFPNVASFLRNKYGGIVATGYVLFNIVFLMLFSVVPMLSTDYSDGTSFGSYSFSFLNW